ncbi:MULTISPECIES: prepilin peptidase [unclassified Yoonia]|uniref:prepilin peptidase n=1 Tax=unclassified Yoonia TaxID=2629118 RepID=UPI002AFE2ED3|nr:MULTISPECIES: prepilin peptidase [unclassified Yoonia]
MLAYVPIVMTLILIAAMVTELRTGKIPNLLTLMPFVLFMLVLVTSPDPQVFGPQLIGAAVVLVIGLVLFAVAGFGAGAVKLLTGLALFVPRDQALVTFGIFVAAIFIGTFLVLQIRKRFAVAGSDWVVLAKGVLPMSWPIGIAGLSLFWLL